MTSILKVSEIQDPTNSNTALTIDASGNVNIPGHVVQVVQGEYSTVVTASSTSYIATGLTASITPTSTSSKILVLVSHPSIDKRTNDTYLGLRLNRDGSLIKEITRQDMFNNQTNTTSSNISYTYLDSPNSASALTYSTVFNSGAGNAQVSINWNYGASTLTLMEIAQ